MLSGWMEFTAEGEVFPDRPGTQYSRTLVPKPLRVWFLEPDPLRLSLPVSISTHEALTRASWLHKKMAGKPWHSGCQDAHGTQKLYASCTQRLQCSSFLVMTYFLLRDYSILPKKGTTFEPLGSSFYSIYTGPLQFRT